MSGWEDPYAHPNYTYPQNKDLDVQIVSRSSNYLVNNSPYCT